MSKGLPGAVRRYLDAMDSRLEKLEDEQRAELVRQALATTQLYQGLPVASLARIIMEPVVAMDGCLARAARPGGDLEREVREFMFSGAALAALLARRERGRPPL